MTGQVTTDSTTAEAELLALGALQVRQRFVDRELSPVEYLEVLQRRVDELEPAINATTEQLWEQARTEAAEAERVYRSAAAGEHDGPLPPLLGLPVATKEKHALAGHTLSQGLSFDAARVAGADNDLVARIRSAGGIVHLRTASPEFSCATFTHSPLWGVTRNPWNHDRSPGGSSGGAGAALAAGFTPLATASDIAGSTRLPAAFTGTVGYKAPYGRIPGAPPLSLDTYRGDGPMARSVADTALLASVMAGLSPVDHSSLPNPMSTTDWLQASRPVDLRGIRVALSVRLGDYPVESAVAAATTGLAGKLAEAGAEVVEVQLPWTTERTRETSFTHFGHLLVPAMREATAGHTRELAEYTRRFMEDAEATVARRSFYEGVQLEAQLQSELATAMAGFDVLLCPTSAVGSLAADGQYLDGIDVGGVHLQHYWEAHMTSPFNIANRCPVLAVPSGVGDLGVPTGVQLVGHPYDDRTVLGVGAAIEQLQPWQPLAP
ncbi:amidase [Naumannella halotolerans]|uniref:amidase n=1 Tax=Naumannella halotolerans TaxID=993414 RepID=UPI00370D979A